MPGVSRGLFHVSGIAATRVQQPVTEGGFLWRQLGFAGSAGLDWQFDGNFCQKQRLVCSQKEFLVTCSIQLCGARGQRVPGAGGVVGAGEGLSQDTQCDSGMILSGLTEPLASGSWETCGFGGDFSGKELRQIQGKFCFVPLENFTLETST